MTWNPRTIFSGRSDDADLAGEASSSFDPSRTGDPLGPTKDGPAIGFGGVLPDGYSSEPRRRPIGFAPPQDESPELRYYTELSFKRHHSAPLASANPQGPGGDEQIEPSVWQTPADPQVGSTEPSAETHGNEVSEPQALDAEPVPDAEPEPSTDRETGHEEKVPFYKREISFRRKRGVPTETPDSAVVDSDAADTETAPQAGAEDWDDAPNEAPQVAAEAELGPDEPENDRGFELPAPEQPFTGDPVAVERSVFDLPAADDPFAAEHEAELPVAEQPFAAEYEAELPVAEQPFAAEYEAELPVAEQPFAAEYEAELPVAEQPFAAEYEAELPVAEQPFAAEYEAELPVAEQPFAAEYEAELPVADEPFAVKLEPDLSAVETSLDETQPSAGLDNDDPAGDEIYVPDEVAAVVKPGRSLGRRRDKSGATAPKRSSGGSAKGRKLVGLKIGASQIAAAVVSGTDAGNELIHLARRPLADGIVVDGEVRDADALAHALKSFFDDEKLPKRDVRIGLASNRIGVRVLDIVGIDDQSQFDNAVRFKAHEVLPVAVHESLLDYRVLEERPSESGTPSRRVLLVVAPRDQVEPYQQVAAQAGLRLAGIDLEALGLLRAFVEPKPFAVRTIDDTATVVVAMGHESSTLLVAGGGVCEFTRVFDWGGGALQDAISQELDVHPAEAATILRHLSLSGPGRQFEGLDDAARTKVVDAMRLRLTPFARELVSSLQFYQTQPDSLGIGEIVITGGTSHLEGLADVLHQMIGVSVRVGDPLRRVVSRNAIHLSLEATIGSMAVPIGLAIDDGAVRTIDLLAGESSKSQRRRPRLLKVAVPAAVAVPVAALGLLFVQAQGDTSTQQSQLDSLQAQISALPLPTKPQIDTNLAIDQQARATAVANVLGGRFAWENVFRDLSRALPQNVWLQHVVATLPAPADPAAAAGATAATTTAAPAGQGVTIDGFTYTQPDVARLLARLGTLPTLTNVTLQSSTVEKLGERDVVHFTVLAELVNGGSR